MNIFTVSEKKITKAVTEAVKVHFCTLFTPKWYILVPFEKVKPQWQLLYHFFPESVQYY